MTGLEQAIEQLQAEVDSYKQGTSAQPPDHSTDWFLLRAKALGLSTLKQMKVLGAAADPAAAERHYRRMSQAVKSGELEGESSESS